MRLTVDTKKPAPQKYRGSQAPSPAHARSILPYLVIPTEAGATQGRAPIACRFARNGWRAGGSPRPVLAAAPLLSTDTSMFSSYLDPSAVRRDHRLAHPEGDPAKRESRKGG